MSLKVGLIGCGRIAMQAHIPNLMSTPEVDLIAFAETEPSRHNEVARLLPRATAFSCYRELLESSDVNAVVICLPNAVHADAAVSALRRGVHVYVEKPLATSSEQARPVIEAWRQAGVCGVMGFNYRFNPLYETVRAHLRAGTLGKVVTVRSVFSTASKQQPQTGLSRQDGGGVLLDLASHHLDLVRYFFDQDVVNVFAEVQSRNSEADCALLQMRLMSGIVVQSFFSAGAIEEDGFEIYGDRGKLSVDRYRSLNIRITEPTLEGFRLKAFRQSLGSLSHAPYALRKMRSAANEPSYAKSLRRFLSAAQSGESIKPDFNDGYQNLKIIEAAEQSAETGCKVQVAARGGGLITE